MSLTLDGTWKAGVWAPTVWADGVWLEGARVATIDYQGDGKRRRKRKPRLDDLVAKWIDDIAHPRPVVATAAQDLSPAVAKIERKVLDAIEPYVEPDRTVDYEALFGNARRAAQLGRLYEKYRQAMEEEEAAMALIAMMMAD